VTTGHLDTVRLAEHAEGLLGPTEADAVEAHLQGCGRCRQTSAALESVTAQLAAAPRTLPLPPDVAARLDRVIDAEHDAVAADRAPVIQLGWFRRRAPHLPAAAPAVSLIGLVGYAVGTSGQGEDDSIVTADAPEMADEPAEAEVEADEDAGAGLDRPIEQQAEDSAAAPDSDEAAPEALAADSFDTEIRALVDRARTGAAEAAADCGQPLADALGHDLIGSAPTGLAGDGAVLVVVDVGRSVVQGWVLPGCDAGTADALTEPRLVTIE
jgi:hypothetical protein